MKCSVPPKWLMAGGPKMTKVNKIFPSFKIGLAKGEHLNFSSLKTHSIGQGIAEHT
jgi:hypothetical protein